MLKRVCVAGDWFDSDVRVAPGAAEHRGQQIPNTLSQRH